MSGILNLVLARGAASAAVETLIAQATGTIIDDGYSANEALAFNGVTTGAASSATTECPSGDPTTVRIGKDLGSGVSKVISGLKIWGSSDGGYRNTGGTVNITLKASNTDPTTASWAGTTIGTIAGFTDADTTQAKQTLGNSNSTGYRYVWIESNARWIAEIEFYEWL